MLTKATTLHPDLPIFAPDFNARVKTDTTGTSTGRSEINGHADLPVAQAGSIPRSAPTTAGANFVNEDEEDDEDDEDEGYGPDEHPPNYPRPGQGLMKTLQPEQEDLQWLVDDDDRFGVFSHLYQVDSSAANRGISGKNV